MIFYFSAFNCENETKIVLLNRPNDGKMECRKRRVNLAEEADEPHREPEETEEAEDAAASAAASSIADDDPGTKDPVGVGWAGSCPTPPLTPTSLRNVARLRSLSPDGKACSSPARGKRSDGRNFEILQC